jgi:predicted transcriptional regulator of viral defense system
MSIKYKDIRGSGGERLASIATLGEIVFHASDVANLWEIPNENTLYKTLSRYVADGLIHRVYKGLYAVKKASEINPFLLGVKAIHSPAYVSCESVLYQKGILNQSPLAVTLVSQFSRHFSIAGIQYRSRKMREEFLFNDAGIEIKDGVRIASIPRAVADMLYFNPRKYFDAGDSTLIQWGKVREIADAVGYIIKGIKS